MGRRSEGALQSDELKLAILTVNMVILERQNDVLHHRLQ